MPADSPTFVLQRVAAGDQAAVQECITRYGDLVWSLARRMAGRDADDAVQEIFIDLWRSAGRFDPAVASETTFVAMIARRRLIDRRRRESRRPGAVLSLDAEVPVAAPARETIDLSAEAAAARTAISTLSEDQQRVLGLSIQRGLAHEQIARATGLPLGTVKTHIRRGLIKVREALEAQAAGQEVRL